LVRLKILFSIPNFDTAGSGKAMVKIIERLNRKLFEPVIMCAHDKGEYFQIVKDSNVPIHTFEYTTSMIPRIKGLIKCFKISRKLKKISPDIIHSFHYGPDYSEPLSAFLAKVPWIYTKKNMNWGGKSKNGWKLRTLFARRVVVQNSDMIKDFFRNSNKISLIHRGVDTVEFQPREYDKDLQNEFNLTKESQIVLTVANLVPVKGVEGLIEAVEILNKPEIKLIIVGHDIGEYSDKLKALVGRRSLTRRVIFTGKRMDVARFYSIADLFVLPTLSKGRMEGSPVVLLEAMASGVISLGSDIPGIRDQLKDFPDQILIPGNSNDLASKISNFLNINIKIKRKIIDHQLTLIREKYEIDHEVEKHQKLYLSVVT